MAENENKEWIRGSLDLMVLSVLAEESRYGYLIQQRLQEATGGLVNVQAGTLYPLLHRLEADKWIRARWDESTGRRRKWYSITAAGRRRLQQQAVAWSKYASCVGKLVEPALTASPRPA